MTGPAGPLAGLRVVELGEMVAGPYAAKLLADFGAEVIKVEPPKGDPARRRGPFPGDVPDPERSGLFLYLNTNKRGVCLDPVQLAGRANLARLLRAADVLITSLPVDRLAACDLLPDALRARHPPLIVTTVTPFGMGGPYAGRRGDELVTYAMGGLADSTPGVPDMADDPDREPPLHPSCFLAETVAGLVAAVATLLAADATARTGQGCHVDVSQQAAVIAMDRRSSGSLSYGTILPGRLPASIALMPNCYLPCEDGHVVIAAWLEHHWQALVEVLGNPAWARSELFRDSAGRTTHWDALKLLLLDWTMRHTGDEIYRLGQARGLALFPFYPLRRTVESDQVRERGSLVEVERDGHRLRMPGPPIHLRGTPWALRRPVPRLGEHTNEVLSEVESRKPQGARLYPGLPPSGLRPPLAGIRVLDFGQVVAIPFCTQWMAWMGADVILVESRRHLTSRLSPPFADGRLDIDTSGSFNTLNSGKRSCVINLSTAAGRALARRLVAVMDVMVDNFATGVLDKLGFGYDEVRTIRPDIVVLSLGAFGRTGPLKDAAGFHSAANMFSGLADVTGYPGGHPRIIGGVFPDSFSGGYALFAILAALRHRRVTGDGQYIDGAMYEAMLSLIPEAVVDYTLNGREPVRIGNRDRDKVPHGVYRCRGEDAWVAISVGDEAEWRAFCEATGHSEWGADHRFLDAPTRRVAEDDLDEAITAWTRQHTPLEAAEILQRAGVTAGPVLHPEELPDDPQLRHHGFIVETDHPKAGQRQQFGVPWRIDTLDGVDYRPAPLFGEHTWVVVRDLLGLSDSEYTALEAQQVFS